MLNTRTATSLWAAGFVGAAALHVIRGREFGATTVWGPNPGWQREIAIWNIGMLVALLRTRERHPDLDREFLSVFAIMALLLGANHSAATLRSPSNPGNWIGALANAGGLAAAVAAGRRG